MGRMRASLLPRVTAFVLAFAVLLLSAEAGVADAHEAVPRSVSAMADQAGQESAPVQDNQPDRSPQDSHPFHVCHCAHTHAIGDFTTHAVAPLVSDHDAGPNPPVIRIPSGRQQEPLIRPPIV
jgi:hypothetical protein